MPLTFVHQDITKIKVDAIVNVANTNLQMEGTSHKAIFEVVEDAVIAPGFNLPAKFIIHATFSIPRNLNEEQYAQRLRAFYTNWLKVAIENKYGSIAFPLVSDDVFDNPFRIATSAIRDFLLDHDLDVLLILPKTPPLPINPKLRNDVENYIDKYYIDPSKTDPRELPCADGFVSEYEDVIFENMMTTSVYDLSPLDALISNLDEPFSLMLLDLINAKGMTEIKVYKRANLDRKLFSKIRRNKGYMPSKRTAIALAIALELTPEETNSFLRRAGYALSHAVKFDVIVEYFITKGKYNIFDINEVLFEYDQPLLGGGS